MGRSFRCASRIMTLRASLIHYHYSLALWGLRVVGWPQEHTTAGKMNIPKNVRYILTANGQGKIEGNFTILQAFKTFKPLRCWTRAENSWYWCEWATYKFSLTLNRQTNECWRRNIEGFGKILFLKLFNKHLYTWKSIVYIDYSMLNLEAGMFEFLTAMKIRLKIVGV